MPRLNVVNPDQTTGELKEIFEGPLKDKQINIFKGMANSAAALKGYLQFSGALKEGQLSDKEREAIALVLAEENGCEYCLAAHTALGKQAGMSDDEAMAARRGEPGDPKLQALVTFAKALREKKGWVEDADLESFKGAGYDDGAVAEVVANYGLNIYSNYFNHVNHTEVDFPSVPASV